MEARSTTWSRLRSDNCLQDIVCNAVRTIAAHPELYTQHNCVLPDMPSPREAFLEAFVALNPFAASLLSSLFPGSIAQLLCLGNEDRIALATGLPGVFAQSIELFFRQAARGAHPDTGAAASHIDMLPSSLHAGSNLIFGSIRRPEAAPVSLQALCMRFEIG